METGQFYLQSLQSKGRCYNLSCKTPILVLSIGGSKPEQSGLTMLTLSEAQGGRSKPQDFLTHATGTRSLLETDVCLCMSMLVNHCDCRSAMRVG